MRDYRVYFLSENGHIRNSSVLDCADDATAIEVARQLIDGEDVELWERARRVAKINHKTKQVSLENQGRQE